MQDDSPKKCFLVYPEQSTSNKTVQSSEFDMPVDLNEILTKIDENTYLTDANFTMVEYENGSWFYKARITCE